MIEGLGCVLVIGGGIGGMATAIALRQRGVEVDLIDSDPDWKVSGAGVTITGPTLRAYRDLGLIEAIREHGFFTTGQAVFLFDGTPLVQLDQQPVAPDLPTAGGIMRPALHGIMSAELKRLGANVRLGITVSSFDENDDVVRVTFSDGTNGTYDLAVAADGIYSSTRSELFPNPVKPRYSGQMSWRVVAPRPPEMDKSEFYFGHANLGGISPCADDKVYGYILSPEPEVTRLATEDEPEAMRALMADFGGHMADIRDGIGPDTPIMRRPFEYALQPKPWHIGRVVLLGDAAHATTAHLASGAGIAVEDSIVLAEELERLAPDVPAALASYTERRFGRCKFVVDSSVALGEHQLARGPVDELGQMMAAAMQVLAEPI